MQIKIPLANCDLNANTYAEFKAFLKQLELSVHHAQKAIEHAEKDGVELTEDSFIKYDHPQIEEEFNENNSSELEYIEIFINLT